MEKRQGVFDPWRNPASAVSITFSLETARLTFELEGSMCEGKGCGRQMFSLLFKRNINTIYSVYIHSNIKGEYKVKCGNFLFPS